jgi:fluoride exporter
MSSPQLRPVFARKLTLGLAVFSATLGLVLSFADVMGAYVSVAIGSALGGIARHWVTVAGTTWFGSTFPWGTLFINVLGSFVIGFFFAISGPDGRFQTTNNARLFVMTGICGGFTTFSAFSLQSLLHFQGGEWHKAGAYIAGSVLLCLFAVWAGYACASEINGFSE